MSLYERLGKEAGIRTAVDDFYRRVVSDPRLEHWFEGIDLPRLRRHQAALLVQVTGGPVEYSGRELAAGHAGLDITPAAFDQVVGHLVATLTDLGVSGEDIAAVGAALGAHRDEIVTAPDAAAAGSQPVAAG
jgi:hemoglobin